MGLFPTHFDRRFVKIIKNVTVFVVPILGPILGPILLFWVLSWGHASSFREDKAMPQAILFKEI